MVDLLASLKGYLVVITSLKSLRGRRAREHAVNRLAELRVEAVTHLLNRRFSSPGDLQRWVSDNNAWRESVLTVLRTNFKPAVARSFETLGVISNNAIAIAYDAAHNWHLNMLAKELEILNNIINRYTQ